MNESTRADRIIGALVGLVGFAIAIDPRVLNPTDVRWLLWGDSAQHYLGWEFFRTTPLLQWPIGANPHFGEGFGESIVYSDAIPLVAIPLKYLSFLLPETFQYLGWWILICFVLQGVTSLALIRYSGVSRTPAAIGAIILVLFPPFLYRLVHEGYGHIALASHWIILLAMLMFVSRRASLLRWSLLATVSLLIQPYLAVFPITLGLWQCVRSHINTTRFSSRGIVSAIVALVVVPLSVFWVVGGFPSGNSRDTGFGTYQATLGSLVDPVPTSSFAWSRALLALDLNSGAATNEGFGFLGSGLLLSLPVAVVILLRRRRLPTGDWAHLLILSAVMAVFALLPSVRIGGRTIVTFPLTEYVSELAGVFRSNGRFIWLLAYTVAVLVLVLVASSMNRVVSLAVPIAVLLVTFVDGATALRETRERFGESADSLIGERHAVTWSRILNGKSHLVTIPPLNNDPQWIDMAALAKEHRLTTTAAYLSRLNESRFKRSTDGTSATVTDRSFTADSVYVFMNYPPNPDSEALVAIKRVTAREMTFVVERIENLVVVHALVDGDPE